MLMEREHRAARMTPAPALLLDTFSLFFRAFYALPPMSTSRGDATGALYGFSALLLKLLREHPGAELCFALDTGKPTFRHKEFVPYKAERAPAPTPLVEQLRRLDELLDRLGGAVLRSPGFEADDVLATVAAELRAQDRPALVVSGDRDLLQLAFGSVQVHFVGRRGKDAITYDEAGVTARFGVPPWRLPSYVALVGDTSDNLPSVPGIGPATAKKLLEGHEDAAALLASLALLTPKVSEVLSAHAEQILQTEALARLRIDAPLPQSPHLATPRVDQWLALRQWFEGLEFKSLLPRLDKLIAAR
jgi:DNA polymerase I